MIRRTWLQMGMPITVALVDETATEADLDVVAYWFDEVNLRFSTYQPESEVSRFNAGLLQPDELSPELAEVIRLSEETRALTGGYFDIKRDQGIDPSGLVKGWAIQRAAAILRERGFVHFFVDAGGDVQANGCNQQGDPWRVGIRNPFDRTQIVKVLSISNRGVATSGTAMRGAHIIDPLRNAPVETPLLSLTIVAPTIFDADRIATAAFAMGQAGLAFTTKLQGFDAYGIDSRGISFRTPGFDRYVV
jgi:thiamine biosynthesis lipoprotein